MAVTTTSQTSRAQGGALNIGLWTAQVLLAAMFVAGGVTKLITPIADLAKMMPWAGDVPETFVRVIALIDLAGGLGILLPSLTRIQPRLTVFAALGCSVLMVFAAVFHVSRGEAMVAPMNLVLLALSLFVLWGRGKKIPIH
jgi:uncharacterized membrane protein YphA (DoxX/SURF4 family)